MTDNKLTDNEIIKALECLCLYEQGDCLKCPIYKSIGVDCMPDILEPALSLINRQKAEIERLNSKIEEKEKLMEYILDGAKVMENGAREKAVKKFEDMLKDQFDRYGVDYTAYAIVDDVAREMESDSNAD